jgi:hypothetical protein
METRLSNLSFGLHLISPVAADLNHDGLPDLILPDVGSANGQTSFSWLQILVDRNLDGTASYGSPRDVTGVFPHAPINIEFSYSLDTAKYADGRTF